MILVPKMKLMGLLVGVIIGILAPRMYLQKKIAQRQHDIQKSLPDVLDLLTVAVEAGLGFDAACDKVVEKMKPIEKTPIEKQSHVNLDIIEL